MAGRASLGRVLAGAAGGAALAGLVIWAAGVPPTGRLPAALLVAAAIGGAAVWWFDRRHQRSLGRLDRHLVARIDDQRQRAVECELDREHLAEILESMSDGVLVTDQERGVELVNPSFRALFAMQEPERQLSETELSELLVGFIAELDAGGAVSRERIETETGAMVELRGRRLSGDRSVVVAHDLTRQLRLDTTIRDLVANVSHELRTPLTAIRGYAENLEEGAIEQPRVASRFVERILVQCRRLEALLEDLLALSRLERSEGIPDTEAATAIDLATLCEAALETVRGLAEERRVELDYSPGPVPAVAGHQQALETMVLNLLENAVKYNREGGSATLGLSSSGDEVAIEVADTGIGLPQRDLSRIFERFYRVDRGRSRAEGGTGLGLAIVKHAAQLHGGRLEVESKLGRGSVFRVYLPVGGRAG